jgi:hypothetical protein
MDKEILKGLAAKSQLTEEDAAEISDKINKGMAKKFKSSMLAGQKGYKEQDKI